ncbi:MAG: HAD family hydrolase [Bacteroidales bacterium]
MANLSEHPISISAVLFDLDGTLVDTIPLIFACYEHALRVHLPGFDPGREAIVANLGRSLGDILEDFAVAARAPSPRAVSFRMMETYRAFQLANIDRLIRPYEGMRETLSTLHARGLTLGVVTSKIESMARLCLEHDRLEGFLSASVFHDDTARHKPDPEPLLYAARTFGLTPGRTAYVGDSINDMMAARAAGMRGIGALWGPATAEALTAAGADAVAERPQDLLGLFE